MNKKILFTFFTGLCVIVLRSCARCVGTIFYPEQFKDIYSQKKAYGIYTFLVGAPVFDKLYKNNGSLAHKKVDISTI